MGDLSGLDLIVGNLAALYRDTDESTALFAEAWVGICYYPRSETRNKAVIHPKTRIVQVLSARCLHSMDAVHVQK